MQVEKTIDEVITTLLSDAKVTRRLGHIGKRSAFTRHELLLDAEKVRGISKQPLAKCRDAVAVCCGYADWEELISRNSGPVVVKKED